MSRVDVSVRVAAGVTVVGLACTAGAISYSHMTHLAHQHGKTGWRGHMFPLLVDGIEIVASLVLFADKHAGRSAGRLPWAALVTGTAASLAANVAVGGSDWIGPRSRDGRRSRCWSRSSCCSVCSTIQPRSWSAQCLPHRSLRCRPGTAHAPGTVPATERQAHMLRV